MDKIQIILDKVSRPHKIQNMVGYVIANCKKNGAIYEATIEEIAEALTSGHAIVPAVLEGGFGKKDWKAQQLFMLDVDNAVTDKYQEKHPEFNLKKISIEEAYTYLTTLGIKPVFMYKSYSYNEAEDKIKFRIVLCANELITDRDKRNKLQATLTGLMFEVGNTDTACITESKVFLGTSHKEIIHADYEARINADEIIDKYYKEDYAKYISKPVTDICGIKKDAPSVKRIKITSDRHCKNEELIKSRDIKALQDELMIVMSEEDTYTKINSFEEYIDMSEFLGIEDGMLHFCCVIHEETNPSAHIYPFDTKKYDENGNKIYIDLYKCFSAYCESQEKALTIVGLVQYMLECTRYEAMKFLSEVYHVTTDEFEFIKQQVEMLNNNIDYITQNINRYPNLLKFMQKNNARYLEKVIAINEILRDKTNSKQKTKDGRMVVRICLDELNTILVKKGVIKATKEVNKNKLSKLFSNLALIGLIDKCSLKDDISDNTKAYYDKAREKEKNTGEKENAKKKTNIKKNEMLLLNIPEYNDELFNAVEGNAEFLVTMGFDKESISQKSIAAMFQSESVLKCVYPDYDKKSLKYIDEAILFQEYNLILEKIINAINEKGYMLRSDLNITSEDYNCMINYLINENIRIKKADINDRIKFPELKNGNYYILTK